MDYLNQLEQEKLTREKAELDKKKLQELIELINVNHNLYGNRFLDSFEAFVKNYK
jgi:hypothetical protein